MNITHNQLSAELILEDGSIFKGISFGHPISARGEVVFNTGMTGYVETLTDPSYKGQILILTYPLIGNYGVPYETLHTMLPHPYESPKIQIQGLVVHRYEDEYSHHAAKMSLKRWLEESGIPAIYGIDTRSLTRKIREYGTMRGEIRINTIPEVWKSDVDMKKVVESVSEKGVYNYKPEKPINKRVMLVDCGVKHNIIRSILIRGVEITRVPFDFDFVKDELDCQGILISNGPGDPKDLPQLIRRLSIVINRKKPLFGICLGHQLISLASSGDTYKMKYGHRSQNQPVKSVIENQTFITSQNHGYAVRRDRIPQDFFEWFVNVNDGTNEGIRHKRLPVISVQFHPEAFPGPVEAGVLFDEFINSL